MSLVETTSFSRRFAHRDMTYSGRQVRKMATTPQVVPHHWSSSSQPCSTFAGPLLEELRHFYQHGHWMRAAPTTGKGSNSQLHMDRSMRYNQCTQYFSFKPWFQCRVVIQRGEFTHDACLECRRGQRSWPQLSGSKESASIPWNNLLCPPATFTYPRALDLEGLWEDERIKHSILSSSRGGAAKAHLKHQGNH